MIGDGVTLSTAALANCSNSLLSQKKPTECMDPIIRGLPRLCNDSNNLLYWLGSLDADQLLIESTVEIRQFIGIESKLRQRGGVQVLDV